MDNDRMITVAIHTLEQAQKLKALLEREGVNSVLQNVHLDSPVLTAGVRVRIAESDLPLALRVIENPEIFTLDQAGTSIKANTIMVPVDFSEKSMHAVEVAYSIAAGTKSKIVLLHAFLVPHTNPLTSLSDSLTLPGSGDDVEEMETSVEIAKIAHRQMQKLEAQIRAKIKSGEWPAVKSSSVLLEGVAEECIGEYLKEHHEVRLLVMGTRAAEKKASDMAGSVTAEVLDSCRVQTLTVPEADTEFRSLVNVRKAALLSHLEQEDFLALDALHRLMPEDVALEINVVCMPNDRYSRATNDAARKALREYCNEHFPTYTFTITEHDKHNPDLEIGNSDLVVVPNRKKNILARLFNPGAAHRMLFHTDIPLLVIPV